MTDLIGKVILAFVIIILISLMGAHIILDCAELYKIDFITQFDRVQIYAIGTMLGMLRVKLPKLKDDEGGDLSDLLVKITIVVVVMLLSWGALYVVHALAY